MAILRRRAQAKNFGAKFEIGKEVGQGHFGHTRSAKGKKGELKGQAVAFSTIVKLIWENINPSRRKKYRRYADPQFNISINIEIFLVILRNSLGIIDKIVYNYLSEFKKIRASAL
jgi:hypothetical protein